MRSSTVPNVVTIRRQKNFSLGSGNDLVDNVVHDGSNDGTKNLSREHSAGSNLQIMTNLQVRHHFSSLPHCVEAKSLEVHVGNGLSRKNKTAKHFSNNIETKTSSRNGIDNTQWQGKKSRHENGKQDTPPWKERLIGISETNVQGDTENKDDIVPPGRHFLVGFHELYVDVFSKVFMTGATELYPDILSIEKSNVNNGSGDTNVEIDIRRSEGSCEVRSTNFSIQSLIQTVVSIEDRLLGIVDSSSVSLIEGIQAERQEGKSLSVPDIGVIHDGNEDHLGEGKC